MSEIMSKLGIAPPAPQASAVSLPNLLTYGRIAAVRPRLERLKPSLQIKTQE